LIDFGSSCFSSERLFTYIQSRFYRAPEVIIEAEYNMEIDMWSLGCIVAEMYNGYPIFPGESEVDQFNYFLQYLGVPSNEFIDKGNKKAMLFNDDYSPICAENSKGKVRAPNTKNLNDFLSGASKNLIDFVKVGLKSI
jgi:dual specificity tyrosine-phosphorylation-regulated kinase 2/3/4